MFIRKCDGEKLVFIRRIDSYRAFFRDMSGLKVLCSNTEVEVK